MPQSIIIQQITNIFSCYLLITSAYTNIQFYSKNRALRAKLYKLKSIKVVSYLKNTFYQNKNTN